jgi:site-specific recombinase XerD
MKVLHINFTSLNQQLIAEYLDWLQQKRGCGSASRNQRLMVIRSFFKYAGMMDCAQISMYSDVSTIPIQKEKGQVVDFFSEEALQALLVQPNIEKPSEARNRFFMILMYDTAARCGEMLNLKIRDLKLNGGVPVIYLTGKGNKTRIIPLMDKTVLHCAKYLEQFHPIANRDVEGFLFYTIAHGVKRPMSADNVAYFMKKYGESAKLTCAEIPERVHPHQLRHTRAIHLYRNGMPLPLLSEFLGHASMESSTVYAYADTEMKRAAIQKADKVISNLSPVEPIWVDDEDMILKLSGLK